jgi:hypothetical protein
MTNGIPKLWNSDSLIIFGGTRKAGNYFGWDNPFLPHFFSPFFILEAEERERFRNELDKWLKKTTPDDTGLTRPPDPMLDALRQSYLHGWTLTTQRTTLKKMSSEGWNRQSRDTAVRCPQSRRKERASLQKSARERETKVTRAPSGGYGLR